MRTIRERLTYANVVSTLALFLVLAGGAAYAAKVGKKSVGSSQLKANAVTTAKIKANAVTTRKIKKNAVATAKIKDGAINSAKIADGTITGADVDAETMPFGQVVHRARGTSTLALTSESKLYPLNSPTYTQAAKESDAFIGAIDITFSAACTAPRSATATVLLDSPNPLAPLPQPDAVASGEVSDEGGGTLSKRIELGPVGKVVPTRFEVSSAKNHTLALVASGSCTAGSGISASFGGVNVIGTK
jgi:hypothetical protein